MQDVSCYNCDSATSYPYATENGYNLVRCADCSLLYVNPRPSDDQITAGAQQGLHEGDVTFDITGRFDVTKVWSYKSILKDLYPESFWSRGGISWLDVGCGHGELIKAVTELSNNGISIKGTEPNVHKQRSAQSRRLDVSYFDLFTHSEKYDVLSLLNVYSHLPDPPGFLGRCREMLHEDGELLIQTGDSCHLSAEDHYRPFSLPDHLSFASEAILREILGRVGFEIVSVMKYPLVYHNAGSLAKELLKLVLPGKPSGLKYMFDPKYRTNMYIRAKRQ